MGRLVCYIDDEGSTMVCAKEMRGETFLDCNNCEYSEEHEKFLSSVRDSEERKNVRKKLTPLFFGEKVKAFLETESGGIFDLVKVHFEDEEGKKRVIEELEKLSERQRELFSKMTVPEKMRVYGFTFDSLARAYSIMCSRVVDLEKRLELIDAMEGKTCMCSAMGLEDGKNAVPYLYCLIQEGADRFPSKEDAERNPCLVCLGLRCGCSAIDGCSNFDSRICKEFVRDTSEYPSVCPHFKPSDEDVERALDLYEIHFCDGMNHLYMKEGKDGYELVKRCRECLTNVKTYEDCCLREDCVEHVGVVLNDTEKA